jgi:hypothetical protein
MATMESVIARPDAFFDRRKGGLRVLERRRLSAIRSVSDTETARHSSRPRSAGLLLKSLAALRRPPKSMMAQPRGQRRIPAGS